MDDSVSKAEKNPEKDDKIGSNITAKGVIFFWMFQCVCHCRLCLSYHFLRMNLFLRLLFCVLHIFLGNV